MADINQIFTVEQSEDVRLVNDKVEQQQLRQHVMLVGHKKRSNAINYAEKAAALALRDINGIEVNIHFGALPEPQSVVKDYLPINMHFLSEKYKHLLQK
ncbi:hypothetical protein ACOBV8_19820 (plasmid) [Pseudoalteromonas espejiana]